MRLRRLAEGACDDLHSSTQSELDLIRYQRLETEGSGASRKKARTSRETSKMLEALSRHEPTESERDLLDYLHECFSARKKSTAPGTYPKRKFYNVR